MARQVSTRGWDDFSGDQEGRNAAPLIGPGRWESLEPHVATAPFCLLVAYGVSDPAALSRNGAHRRRIHNGNAIIAYYNDFALH